MHKKFVEDFLHEAHALQQHNTKMNGDDRRRSCRPGSYAFARKHGGHHSTRALARVAHSSICDGRGLFATRFLRKDTPITTYGGRRVRSVHNVVGDDALYLYELQKGSGFIVGERVPLDGNGVAQLANDAIHPELTGASNNARFEEREEEHGSTIVYLVADADIELGQEILVEYHISYWIALRCHESVPPTISEWCHAHAHVQDALKRQGIITCIEAYRGVRTCDDSMPGVNSVGVADYLVLTKRQKVRECEVLLVRHDAQDDNQVCTHIEWRWKKNFINDDNADDNNDDAFTHLCTVVSTASRQGSMPNNHT